MHIARTVETLSAFAGPVTLACLGHGGMPAYQEEQGIAIRRCLKLHPNFLKRTELFADFLAGLADRVPAGAPTFIHFRDIWSGIPLLQHPRTGRSKSIFEVNALPSIELPVHYPLLSRNRPLLSYIRSMESHCLARADAVVTVSSVTAAYLAGRGVDPAKISVIPNMAEIPPAPESAGIAAVDDLVRTGHEILLYAGTLAPWQGLDVLLKAMTHLRSRSMLRLVIVASNAKYERRLRKLAARLGIADRIVFLGGIAHEAMPRLYGTALVSVAPLVGSDRNELQGCCPLKIVESMAAGTPVVATDLAVCRELIEHGRDGLLVAAGSSRALARGLLALLEDRKLRDRLGEAARARAHRTFGRDRFAERLAAVYERLAPRRQTTGSDWHRACGQNQEQEVGHGLQAML